MLNDRVKQQIRNYPSSLHNHQKELKSSRRKIISWTDSLSTESMMIRSTHSPNMVTSLTGCDHMDLTVTAAISSLFNTCQATKSSASTSALNFVTGQSRRRQSEISMDDLKTQLKVFQKKRKKKNFDIVATFTQMDSPTWREVLRVYSGYAHPIASATIDSPTVLIGHASYLESRINLLTNLTWKVRPSIVTCKWSPYGPRCCPFDFHPSFVFHFDPHSTKSALHWRQYAQLADSSSPLCLSCDGRGLRYAHLRLTLGFPCHDQVPSDNL